MAIQVRLDLTPAEFDLLRRALAAYRDHMLLNGENAAYDPPDRRKYKAEALAATDLHRKLS
jgi:hypothetical protein